MTPPTDEVQATVPEETPAQEAAPTKEERAQARESADVRCRTAEKSTPFQRAFTRYCEHKFVVEKLPGYAEYLAKASRYCLKCWEDPEKAVIFSSVLAERPEEEDPIACGFCDIVYFTAKEYQSAYISSPEAESLIRARLLEKKETIAAAIAERSGLEQRAYIKKACVSTMKDFQKSKQNRAVFRAPNTEGSDTKCPVCGRCFTSVQGVLRHHKIQHGDEKPLTAERIENEMSFANAEGVARESINRELREEDERRERRRQLLHEFWTEVDRLPEQERTIVRMRLLDEEGNMRETLRPFTDIRREFRNNGNDQYRNLSVDKIATVERVARIRLLGSRVKLPVVWTREDGRR